MSETLVCAVHNTPMEYDDGVPFCLDCENVEPWVERLAESFIADGFHGDESLTRVIARTAVMQLVGWGWKATATRCVDCAGRGFDYNDPPVSCWVCGGKGWTTARDPQERRNPKSVKEEEA